MESTEEENGPGLSVVFQEHEVMNELGGWSNLRQMNPLMNVEHDCGMDAMHEQVYMDLSNSVDSQQNLVSNEYDSTDIEMVTGLAKSQVAISAYLIDVGRYGTKDNVSHHDEYTRAEEREDYDSDWVPDKSTRIKRKAKHLQYSDDDTEEETNFNKENDQHKGNANNAVSNSPPIINNDAKQRFPFYCCFCKRKLNSKSSLWIHKRRSCPKIFVKCQFCGRKRENESDLAQHEASHKMENRVNYDGVVCYQCQICYKIFLSKQFMIKHLGSHKLKKITKKLMTFPNDKPVFQCQKCGKRFKKEWFLKRHNCPYSKAPINEPEPEQPDENPFKCFRCQNAFKTEKELQEHQFIHDKKKFPCEKCGKLFMYKWYLYKHTLEHTKEAPFECPICNEQFETKKDVTQHLSIHSEEKPFTCPNEMCQKRFVTKKELKEHQVTHDDELKRPVMKCSDCGKSFLSMPGLAVHRCMANNEAVPKKDYGCSYCDKRFLYRSTLKRHEKIHLKMQTAVADENTEKSGPVGKTQKLRSDLDEHETKATGTKNQKQVDKEAFQCLICQKIYSSKGNLIRHEAKKHNKVLMKCTYCSRRFENATQLEEHEQNHAKERAFKCTHCSKTFDRVAYLKQHEQRHTYDKPYKCLKCPKAFVLDFELKSHQKVHENNRLHCQVCGKISFHKWNLYIHMLDHMEEEPFECPICKEEFESKDDVAKHLESHSEEKPFQCSKCTKGFTIPTHLQEHQAVHTAECPFKCSDCEKSFKRLNSLKRHNKIHVKEGS